MAAEEQDVTVRGCTLRVRQSGDLSGRPVIHFHGTPGSRLELAWGEDLLEREGVRLVTFDRPGYGRSSEAPYTLSSVAGMALEVADILGIERLATMGMSGGGPFALATAAVGGERVSAVGVASGAGPFQLVPGALDILSDVDKEAVGYLPDDPQRAAATFASGFEPVEIFTDVAALRAAFDPVLSDRDHRVLDDEVLAQAILSELQESLRPGRSGAGWDNVAWVGAWDFDPRTVEVPVLLWYGTEDLMAPREHAQWFAENLANPALTMREGYGHFGIFEHLGEMLRELLAA